MKKEAAKNIETAQLVTFFIDEELYGIEIEKVREVLHCRDITKIPESPEFIEGVIRLRDQIIPVLDMRKRFLLGDHNAKRRKIIIIDMPGSLLGTIVDETSRVVRIPKSTFEALPDVAIEDVEKDCVSAIVKTNEEMIIVLAPERLLTSGEKTQLAELDYEKEMERIDESRTNADSR